MINNKTNMIKSMCQSSKMNLDKLNITKLSDEQVKQIILDRLACIDRKGVRNLVDFVARDHNGYFKVGCHRHHHFKGGMARHALGVYLGMRKMNRRLGRPSDDDSLALVGLMHDLCDAWGCKHRGHGRASVRQLEQLGVDLLPGERYAILNHMGCSHPYQWALAQTMGALSAPDSGHRLLMFMVQDGKDASRYPHR